MALTTPILPNSLIPFDASIDYTITFQVLSGDQVFKNKIEIRKVNDNTVVYSHIETTFTLTHLIPANTLQNGIEYKIRIRTYNQSDQTSQWSDYCYVKCLSTPIIDIPTIPPDGKLNNQTVLFEGSYLQSQGELLKSYKFILYDESENEIGYSPEKYGLPIEYEFTGLLDDKNYFIELIVYTQSGIETSTGLIPFTVDYISPKIQTLFNLTNNYNNATIKLDARIVQLFFKSKNGTYTFENDTFVNLNTDTIYLSSEDGFDLAEDFTIKMHLKGLQEDVTFMTLYGVNGKIEFMYYDKKIHVYRTFTLNNSNFKSHYASEVVGVDKLVIDIDGDLQLSRSSEGFNPLQTYNITDSSTLETFPENNFVKVGEYNINVDYNREDSNNLMIYDDNVLKYHYSVVVPETYICLVFKSINGRISIASEIISG